MQLLKIFGILFFQVLSYMATPFLTTWNIDYIRNHQGDIQYGVILFLATIFATVVHKIFFSQFFYNFTFFGINIKNCLNMMIFTKSLRYSTLADKQFSEAEIINYCQTDAERMTLFGVHLAALFYGPIQIIFSFGMMYFYVGISFLAGIGAVIVLLIVSYLLSILVNKYNNEMLTAKDQRMKATT